MPQKPILIVEDEEDIMELISFNLEKNGYIIRQARSGEEALTIIRNADLQLILLDLMLPGLSGLEICKIVRHDQRTRHTPIIMVTAKGSEEDIVTGLDLGADDYLTKPFAIDVLISRIRALLRRLDSPLVDENSVLSLHGLRIDPRKHIVTLGNEFLDLTYTEFAILQLLAMRPGWAFTRNQIVDHLRGPDYPITDRSVDVQIVGLRKKMGQVGPVIETVRGIGYRMREENPLD